ncbi:MAG: HAD family phosphatase [Lachnospiraceae bacterium]|nr:HAD family phosphatase [Lachnospiraceae bacterium]
MKAVVFDMDGVLFDTERLCLDSWNHVAKKRGIQGVDDIFEKCIGLNGTDTKVLVLEHLGNDFPYDDFRVEASEWFWDYISKKGIPLKTGVKKILSYLKQSDYRVGLASSTRYESIIKHLKQAEIIDCFSVIVAGDMIEHSKPKPDIYLLACRKLNVKPEEAYAVEDSPNGIRSAAAAGMKPILVPDMVKPDAEIEQLSFMVCDDLIQVMKFLNQ